MIRAMATAALMFAASSSMAAMVVPAYSTFGNLSGATFGGSGIPTNPTAITTTQDGITLGLTAFGRFCNAPLTNDGAGRFTASVGLNDGLCPGSPHALGTTWGFGYYVDLGRFKFSEVAVDLFYDLNPGAGTDLADLGRIDFDTALGTNSSLVSLVQDSQNLAFAFFSAGVPGVVFAPSSAPFDPNEAGEYALMLRVSDLAGNELARSAILVSVVPEPAMLALVSLALLGVGATRRRT